MGIAIIAACGLWGVSWALGKKLDSAWGVLLPCIALLLTVVMLFNQRLRHYLLLPSCLALAGGLAAVSVNFHLN